MFVKRNYKEAIEMYTKAIEKASTAAHYTNRALCYFKLQQWMMAIDDCRRAIEIDPHSVKAYFFLGQSLSELNHYDEAIVHLKQAHELAKELHENYGDEITRTIRNLKRKRWNFLEEKRIKQEIELQTYLNRLMLDDKQKQITKIRENSVHSSGKKSVVAMVTNGSSNVSSSSSVKPSTSVSDGAAAAVAAATTAASNGPQNQSGSSIVTNGDSQQSDANELGAQAMAMAESVVDHVSSTTTAALTEKEKQQIEEIEAEYLKKVDELNRLFVENDARRRKREIPDYLCGKISFELMHDPVITPSGITYDRYDIEQHLQRVGRFDPVTRQELTIDQLIPNLSMKEVIENFILENDWLDGAL